MSSEQDETAPAGQPEEKRRGGCNAAELFASLGPWEGESPEELAEILGRPRSRSEPAGARPPLKDTATHVRWVRDTLKVLLRLLDITNREVEEKNGWCHGYLSRLFAGQIELRLAHILAIAEAAGFSPAEFFHLTYPVLPRPLSPPAAHLYQHLRRFQDGGP